MVKKHFLKIAFYYFLLVIGLVLILGGYLWYMNRQNLVRLNLARPNFPYVKYSVDELEKMYPQYPNEKVATVQTPEQTYAKFIEALKRGDVDGAGELLTIRKYKEYKEILNKAKEDNKMQDILNRLDFPLKKQELYEAYALYSFEGVEKKTILEFIKDVDGIWKIDSL